MNCFNVSCYYFGCYIEGLWLIGCFKVFYLSLVYVYSWVQSQLQNHPDELWEDGVRDYLTHASNILVIRLSVNCTLPFICLFVQLALSYDELTITICLHNFSVASLVSPQSLIRYITTLLCIYGVEVFLICFSQSLCLLISPYYQILIVCTQGLFEICCIRLAQESSFFSL